MLNSKSNHCHYCEYSTSVLVEGNVDAGSLTDFDLEQINESLCQNCSKYIARKINTYYESQPLDDVLIKAKAYKVDKQFIENIDYTIEDGLYVFSRWFHLKRGQCCENKCRHCPYTKW